MSYGNIKNALNQYGRADLQAQVAYATPHRLILMLMEGALDKIAKAKGHMQRKEIAAKGNFTSWAISIIQGLRVSLDFEKGGEIAANLEQLYDYMQRRIVEANLKNDVAILDEVYGLLSTIKDAWVQIEKQVSAESDVAGQDSNDGARIANEV